MRACCAQSLSTRPLGAAWAGDGTGASFGATRPPVSAAMRSALACDSSSSLAWSAWQQALHGALALAAPARENQPMSGPRAGASEVGDVEGREAQQAAFGQEQLHAGLRLRGLAHGLGGARGVDAQRGAGEQEAH